jgi:hypothetical protein
VDNEVCERRSHSDKLGLELTSRANLCVCRHDRFGHGAAQAACEIFFREQLQRTQLFLKHAGGGFGGQFARHVAPGVAPHAVRDHGDAEVRDELETILVAGSDLTNVGLAHDGRGCGHQMKLTGEMVAKGSQSRW